MPFIAEQFFRLTVYWTVTLLVKNVDTGTLWPETSPNKYCEVNEQLDNVANQLECQIQCLGDDDCIGIVYSQDIDFCYKCSDGADVDLDNSFGFGFYAKPGITIVLWEYIYSTFLKNLWSFFVAINLIL